LRKSAIILAGGFSKRLGQDKGLINLAGKPLLTHVLDRIFGVVDEIAVVVSSESQKRIYKDLVKQKARVTVDKDKSQSPLVGASTGFENTQGEYSLLLSCDAPFVSSQIALRLLDLCVNRSAVIPRWPNGFVEPLQAAYHTKSAEIAAETALENGKMDLQSMIALLRGVRYISTMVIQQIDPKLLTFLNINTLGDLKKAEFILKSTSQASDYS
jgi:molybdopterin-guanine dinucleotide biosynthesis protein A